MRSLYAAAELCLAFAPFAGFVGFTIARQPDTTPWIAGIASVLVTALMIPLVKWMMKRIDGDSRQSKELAERREKREDDRQVAFAQLVTSQAQIVRELQLLQEQHDARQDSMEKLVHLIENLPAMIVRKCNEKPLT